LIPAQGKAVLAHVGHTQTRHDSQRQGAVDQTFPEFSPLGILVVEVELVGVVSQQGEPDIVGFSDGSAETAAIDIPDFEVFKVAAFPTGLDGHRLPPLFYNPRLTVYTTP
jgi:hypothetical protein